MKFKFNNLEYEVPEGIDIEVEVEHYEDETHVDFNFVRNAQWGLHIPMLGGTNEEGRRVESWADAGIKELT